MSTGSLLNFLGGLLVFIAAALPLLSRAWSRAVARGYQHLFRAMTLWSVSALLLVAALILRYAFDIPGVGALRLGAYLIVIIIEFCLRPGEILRFEIVFFVVGVVAVYSLLNSFMTAPNQKRVHRARARKSGSTKHV